MYRRFSLLSYSSRAGGDENWRGIDEGRWQKVG
jgi:hypothetical protein